MRLLLLLITLTFNALYPAIAVGSVCVSEATTTLSETEASQPQQNSEHPCHHPDKTTNTLSCDCCDDNTPNAIHSMNCDSGCCVGSMVSSPPLTTAIVMPVSHPMILKPTLTFISFYTRSISPELRPPLV